MSKLLAGVIAALIVGVGVAAASSLTASDDDPIRTGTVSTLDDSTGTIETTETTGTGTTETGEDISGPCDEAEHANDPRCVGGGTATDDDDDRGRNRGSSHDDEDDDHRGRGHGGDDDGGDDHGGGDDDRSGSNSGRDD
jgi:hypothetical protein